jgi:hypothetical protein
MPYVIVKKGDKFLVKTKDTGKIHGTFPSRNAALAQLRALYANVPDASAKPKA